MPDKFRSKQMGGVADILGEYLDYSLKRQEQFKSPPDKTVQVRDEAGNVFWKTVSHRELKEGVLARSAEKAPDYGKQFDDKYNLERGFLSDEQRALIDNLSTQARNDKDFSKEELKALGDILDREVAKNEPKKVTAKFPIDLIDKDILDHLEKIEDLKRYPKVRIEKAVPVETKKRFGFDFLAADVPAKDARYIRVETDDFTGEIEEKDITKQEYEGLLKAQENREKDIELRETKIKALELKKERLSKHGYKATVKRKPLGEIFNK